MILSAALVFLVLRWTGVATVEEFVGTSQVGTGQSHPARGTPVGLRAVAGRVIMLPYRCYLIPGALVALMIIKAAAMVRMALAADEPTLITKDWNVSVSTYY